MHAVHGGHLQCCEILLQDGASIRASGQGKSRGVALSAESMNVSYD